MTVGAGLVCAFWFLVKAAVNVFFITSQAAFFKHAGVAGLPYVYTAMNVLYISLQAALVQRLKAHSAQYLSRLSLAFFALSAARVAWGGEGAAAAAAFLLAVMVYDLFLNQFFFHWINDVFPLQEGKSKLPVVTGFGSLAFIASGLSLKVSLSVLSVRAAQAVAVAVFAGCCVLFELARRAYPHAETSHAPGKAGGDAGTAVPALGQAIIWSGFLLMVGKYWLDFQYSRAIAAAFPGERELASFIAVFTSATDFLVLVSQMALAPAMLHRFPLALNLAAMPAAVFAGSAATFLLPSPYLVLATQFLFTYLAKSIHNSAAALLLPALPSATRLRVMSLQGIAASAGSTLVGLALIAVQSQLTVRPAFAVNVAVFGALLVLAAVTGRAYRRQLAGTLDESAGADRAETIADLAFVEPGERLPLVERLLAGDAEQRLKAIGLAGSAGAHELLAGVVERETEPRVLATAARVLASAEGPKPREAIARLLRDSTAGGRVRANLAEALGESPAGPEFLGELRKMLDDPSPRARAAAAEAVVRLAGTDSWVEEALGVIDTMRRDALDSPSRAAAVTAMGRLRHEAFLQELAAALGDPEPSVAGQAVTALGMLDDPAAPAMLRRYVETEPPEPLLSRARAELQRLSRLAMGNVSQLLDSLTESERLQAAGYLARAQGDERMRLFLRALALTDAGARRAMCRFLDAEESAGWLGALARALPGEDRYEPGELAGHVERAGFDRQGLRKLVGLLMEHGRSADADLVLTAMLRRLSQRPAGERVEEAGLARELLAARCRKPAQALEALDRLEGADPFAASLAHEYLATELDREQLELLKEIRVHLPNSLLPPVGGKKGN